MQILRSSATTPITFFMADNADHITGVTGLSPSVTVSKNGGSFSVPAGAVSEIGFGWYKVAPNATDTDTLGDLLLHATATGADAFSERVAEIVAFDPRDAFFFANAMFDAPDGVEAGLTLRQSHRAMSAALAGKVSGAGTPVVKFRNVPDNKDRITADCDTSGNRTNVTLDLT